MVASQWAVANGAMSHVSFDRAAGIIYVQFCWVAGEHQGLHDGRKKLGKRDFIRMREEPSN
jgi:predicted heme/steroid binding protein